MNGNSHVKAIEIHESFSALTATGHEWLDPGEKADQKRRAGKASTEDDPVKKVSSHPRSTRKPKA